ncbi:MAG: hypothetical protein AVDCRST_MAG73-2030, partial [uncultured Thermomicrobiales bacterium]
AHHPPPHRPATGPARPPQRRRPPRRALATGTCRRVSRGRKQPAAAGDGRRCSDWLPDRPPPPAVGRPPGRGPDLRDRRRRGRPTPRHRPRPDRTRHRLGGRGRRRPGLGPDRRRRRPRRGLLPRHRRDPRSAGDHPVFLPRPNTRSL